MFNLNIAVDPADVLDAFLMTRDEDAVIEFITDLESRWGDWDLTERLYKHFKTLHKEYKEEKKYLGELFK